MVKGLQLILYPYSFLLTTLNENINKEKNNNIRTIYLQIRWKSLSVICMEIEGSVKLLENVHNIRVARKSAISSQTGYRTRTKIVPKFLKNAVKTLCAFCVFYNDRIYLWILSEAKTCFLEPMFIKLFAYFCMCIIISSHQAQGPEEFRVNKWITYLKSHLEKCLYLSLSTIN